MGGASLAQAFGVLLVVILLLFLGEVLWAYVLDPAGRLVRDKGAVGLGRQVYSNFLKPILYGKDK
jgi:hypothetical protein